MKDIVITLSDVEYDDDNEPYAVSKVYRFDFQGTSTDLEELIDKNQHLFVEGGPLKN